MQNTSNFNKKYFKTRQNVTGMQYYMPHSQKLFAKMQNT